MPGRNPAAAKLPPFKPLSISPAKKGSAAIDGTASTGAVTKATSPLRANQKVTAASDDEKAALCTQLAAQVAELEKELNGEDPQQIIKEHIRLLHEYNEVKDVTQILLGRLALIDGLTVKAVHQRYELPLDG